MATNKKNDAPVAVSAEALVAPATPVVKVGLPEVGQMYSTLIAVGGLLAGNGVEPKTLVQSAFGGKSVIVKPATKDGEEILVEMTPENWERIEAALANLPNFRQQFQAVVLGRLGEFRKSETWTEMIGRYEGLQSEIDDLRTEMVEIQKTAAAPFDANAFADLGNFYEVKPRGGVVAAKSGNGGARKKAASKADWSKGEYHRNHNGRDITLMDEGDAWRVYDDDSGAVLSEGETQQEATKIYLVDMGLSPSVSIPSFWGANKG